MRKILYFLLAAAVVGGFIGYKMYNKPHENIQAAATDVRIDAAQLFTEYNDDEAGANARYLDKMIAVAGKVKEATKGDDGTVKVMLETGSDFGVVCELDPLSQHARTEFQPGESVTLKGKCAGLNLDVQLTRCVEAK